MFIVRNRKRWFSFVMIFAMLLSVLPPLTANAAASRITITSLYKTTNSSTGLPANDSSVTRYTINPISISASIENITDAQVPTIYYEITNMNTGSKIAEKNNKPVHSPGGFDITFNNVFLTEGLNKITIKMGESNVVESAPGWAYYTATTNISNLKINGDTFNENEIYPKDPQQSTTINLSGTAANASEVQAYLLGDATAKTAFLNNGEFFLVGDDINKTNSIANLQLKPGDNPITLIATNNMRNYSVEKNLIYDNGKPFAFNATIEETGAPATKEKLATTPTVTSPNVTISALLKDNLTQIGNLEYRYVDIQIAGKKYGPYDLSGATAAVRAMDMSPKTINEGYSKTLLSIIGTELGGGITMDIEDKSGASVYTGPDALTAYKTAADKTVQLYELPAGLTHANAPYKVTVKDSSSKILNQFSLQVINASVANTVDTAATEATLTGAGFKQGYSPADTAGAGVVFTTPAGLNAANLRVDVTDLAGNAPLGTANGSTVNGSTIEFPFPSGLAEGQYKIRITYNGNQLTERYFEIAAPDSPLPDATPYGAPLALTDVSGGSVVNPTYLVVKGTNFGNDIGKIDAAPTSPGRARLINTSDSTIIDLIPYDVNDSQVVFKLADQSSLADGATYDIAFTIDGHALTVDDAIFSDVKTVGATYDGAYVASVSPEQVTLSDIQNSAAVLTMVGDHFDMSNMLVQVMLQDGTPEGNATVTSVSPDQKQALVSLPANLAAGNHLIRVSQVTGSTTNFLGQFPLAVANPVMSALSPTVKSITATSPTSMTITGANLGRQTSSLKLRFISDSNPSAPATDQTATSVHGGTQAVFALPSLPEGTYTVTLLYNDVSTGSTLKYTVSSPPASLQENATWSKANQYKVFQFQTDLTIPSDRYQLVEFRFYNFVTDNVPPTTFSFNYVDPSLPYIDHLTRRTNPTDPDGVLITESGISELNELPSTFYVYTDTKTKKINIYTGDYDLNSTPNQTLYSTSAASVTINGVSYYKHTFTLDGLQNGETKLTIIPSSDPNTGSPAKSGENPSGKKTYLFNITSTPYIIVNNIYNGMVVKDPNSDITCTIGGVPTPRCISGRLINISQDDYDNVEVLINGQQTNLQTSAPSDFDSSIPGKFNLQLGPTRIDFDAGDGKNTVEFRLYKTVNGVKQFVSKTTYEIFIFSQEAADFLSIRPIETSDVPKFTQVGTEDQYTYVTTETAVSFSGQFTNANEIQLMVHYRDENGNPVPKYDRRYNNFGSQDPVNGNPGFFSTVNSPVGQFRTNVIPINLKGDTIFDFTVTNASKVTKTRTITIRREPEAYKVIYPTLVRVGKEDIGYINSNYIEIEMVAENADSIIIGKDAAVKREVLASNGLKENHFFYEAHDLKSGKNTVKFTVVTGNVETKGTFYLYNADQAVEGAQYKTPLKNKMKVFGGLVELDFPRNTALMRNEEGTINPYLTEDRKVLVGIANPDDGRVDKYKHPASYDGQINNPNPLISSGARLLLTEPTGRFSPASPLIWTDAGTIDKNEGDLTKAYNGSGRLPYDASTFYTRSGNDLVVPTERGTITLKYDPIIRDDSWKYLTVFHFDISEDSTGIVRPSWRNLGGVVDVKKQTITVPLDTFGYYQVMRMDQSFDDVIGHPWARNDLDTLYSKGIMLPKAPPNAFLPNDPISRGEFATLLVKAFDIPLHYSDSPTFIDVLRYNPLTNGLYDYKYIETAASAGIIRGFGGGRFMPDNSITREDAAVMIAKANNLKLSTNSEKTLQALQKMFTDAGDINLYAQPAIEAIAKKKLISGKENVLQQGQKQATFRFDPKENLSRAEAAVIAINVLRDQKKIPK